MDSRLPGVYLLMEQLGEFKREEFDDRLLIQKSVYLMQLMGIDLRFRYSWYLRGPFSKGLSHAVYEIDEDVKQRARGLSLRSEVTPVLDQMKKIAEQMPQQLNKPRWFELVASIHFLIHISGVEATKKEVAEALKERGKDSFEPDDIDCAWKCLEEVGLLQNKTLSFISGGQ